MGNPARSAKLKGTTIPARPERGGAGETRAMDIEESVMMWGWGYGPGWGMWGFGWLIPLLIAAGVVFCLVRMRHRQRGDSALDILRERFARGELSKPDFDRMKQDLG
jgi:putative membrane protein